MTNDEAIAKWPKLGGVHPVLIRKIALVLQAMELLGYPMKVVQGVRTAEYQRQLYEQGRTKPGKIVTNTDGYKKKSNHQAKDDGFGHAVDCAFVDINDPDDPSDDAIDWREDLPWAAYGKCAVAVGLRWGGDWESFKDKPHVELPRLV